MAFRRILQETSCDALTLLGIDGFANRFDHLDWFLEQGGTVAEVTYPEVLPSHDYFVSFDLDVVTCAAAPGVSAPSVVGMEPAIACNYIWASGRQKHVRYFDIMELNPKYDIDGRTARLAARLFLSFIAGYAQRDG